MGESTWRLNTCCQGLLRGRGTVLEYGAENALRNSAHGLLTDDRLESPRFDPGISTAIRTRYGCCCAREHVWTVEYVP